MHERGAAFQHFASVSGLENADRGHVLLMYPEFDFFLRDYGAGAAIGEIEVKALP